MIIGVLYTDSYTYMAKAKSKKSRDQLIDISMNYLAKNGFEVSLGDLCKATKIKKTRFKEEFESIEKFEQFVWCEMMRSALSTSQTDAQFASFSKREKLLSVYYLFFENCGLNSDFLKASINHHGKRGMLPVLSNLKEEFVSFISAIHQLSLPLGKQYKASLSKISDAVVGEAFYGQLLLLLDFWSSDSSLDYEKTDIAIEKTVRASMDMLDVTPVKSVIDFAKFFWQERVSKTI